MIKMEYYNEFGYGDLSCPDQRLTIDDGLATFVGMCLFSDRRAQPGDRIPPGNTPYRGGWWFHNLVTSPDDIIGSRLWTLQGAKIDASLIRDAEAMAREALQVLLNRKVASALHIRAFVVEGRLNLEIGVDRPNQSIPRWSKIWENITDAV